MEERRKLYILVPVMTLCFSFFFEQVAYILLLQWALQMMWQVLAPRLGKAVSLSLFSIWKGLPFKVLRF